MTDWTTLRIKKDLHLKIKLHCTVTNQKMEDFVDRELRRNKYVRQVKEHSL